MLRIIERNHRTRCPPVALIRLRGVLSTALRASSSRASLHPFEEKLPSSPRESIDVISSSCCERKKKSVGV